MTFDRVTRAALYAALLWPSLALGAYRSWPQAILELVTLLGLACWVLRMLREGELTWRPTAVDLPLLLLIALVGIQLVLGNRPLASWALAPPPPAPEVSAGFPSSVLTLGTVAPSHTASSLGVLLTYAAVYVLVVNAIRTRHQVERLVITLVTFGGALAFAALLDHLAGRAWLLRWRDTPLAGRLAGTFSNPDHFAAWLAMLICLGLGALAARRAEAPAPLGTMLRSRELRDQAARRYLPFVGLAVMAVALVFTLSRGGLLSLVVTMLAVLALSHRLGVVRSSVAVVAALVLVAFVYAAWIGLEPLLARVRHGEYASRWIILVTTLPMIASFPVLGVGLGAYGDIYGRYQPAALQPGKLQTWTVHNDVVQLTVELGLIGAAIVLLMLWRVSKDLIGAHLLGRADCPVGGGEREGAVRHDPFSVGISVGAVGALIALLVHSVYDFPAHIPANGVLGAACLGLATVALHTRFRASGPRLLTPVVVYSLVQSRWARRGLFSLITLVTILAAEWVIREPIVNGRLETARSATDRATALHQADRAVESDGGNPHAREVRGRLRLEAALDVWNVGATPDKRVLLAWDQRRHAALPLLGGAIDDLRTALSQTPLSASVHENLGNAHWAMALIDVTRAPEHLGAALASFSRSVASVPESPYPYRELATFAVPQGGRFTEVGLRAARGAVVRDPAILVGLVDRFVPLGLTASQWLAAVPETAPDRLALAALLETRRLTREAADVYRAATEIAAAPDNVVARWRLARLLLEQGRTRESIVELERALTQDSGNPVLHLERARALASLGEAAALDAYQLAVTNAEVMARRPAKDREPFGRLTPRVQALVDDVVQRDGGPVDRYRQTFAQYLTERKLWEQALTQWTALLGDSPNNPTAHFGRAVCLEALGARERAVEAYREAVALDANNVPLRLRFADSLWRTDQYHQAINEWRAVLGRAPGNVDARLALARAYVRTGSLSEASHEYQHVLLIDPSRSEARQELARLPRTARQ